MTTHNKTSAEIIAKAITHKVTVAGTVGLLAVIIAWIIEFSSQEIAFSVRGIITIHSANPTLWLINSLPLIFIYFTYINVKKHQEKVSFLEEEIGQRDQDRKSVV